MAGWRSIRTILPALVSVPSRSPTIAGTLRRVEDVDVLRRQLGHPKKLAIYRDKQIAQHRLVELHLRLERLDQTGVAAELKEGVESLLSSLQCRRRVGEFAQPPLVDMQDLGARLFETLLVALNRRLDLAVADLWIDEDYHFVLLDHASIASALFPIASRPALEEVESVLDEQGSQNQRDHRHQFDEDVHRRTGGVFERIADGITDDGGYVGL